MHRSTPNQRVRAVQDAYFPKGKGMKSSSSGISRPSKGRAQVSGVHDKENQNPDVPSNIVTPKPSKPRATLANTYPQLRKGKLMGPKRSSSNMQTSPSPVNFGPSGRQAPRATPPPRSGWATPSQGTPGDATALGGKAAGPPGSTGVPGSGLRLQTAAGPVGKGNLFPHLDEPTPEKPASAGSRAGRSGSGGGGVPQGPVAGVSLVKGRRPYMEDEHRVVMRMEALEGAAAPPGGAATSFFGLFDGHAGGRCSKAVAAGLPGLIAATPEFGGPPAQLAAALTKGFAKTNQEWMRRADRYNMTDGSTAIVGVVRGGRLWVANVGDSRAVLGAKGGKAVAMSQDHKPNKPEERRRIAAAGGHVVVSMGVPRVNGVLAVSRAFGDRNLRPVVKADPEIRERALEPGDAFLILGTDGLWDMVTNQEAANVVHRGLDDLGAQGCAEMLTTVALRRGSMDNASAMVVDLRALAPSHGPGGGGGGGPGGGGALPPATSHGDLGALAAAGAPSAGEAAAAGAQRSPGPPPGAGKGGNLAGYRYSRNP